MGHEVTIGGSRLGAGKKMKAHINGFERSTHDLSFAWRSSMSNGTLVPCLNLVGLPGDTFNIDIDAFSRTLPTVRPLFGSYKVQIDVFTCPFRLYHSALHNNKLGIGMNMSSVVLPKIEVKTYGINSESVKHIDINNRQINQSSLLAYLGIRGTGHASNTATDVIRRFNAIPLLSYWDIYKNYYANKQEPNGYYMNTVAGVNYRLNEILWGDADDASSVVRSTVDASTGIIDPAIEWSSPLTGHESMRIKVTSGAGGVNGSNIVFSIDGVTPIILTNMFEEVEKITDDGTWEEWLCFSLKSIYANDQFTYQQFIMSSNVNTSVPTSFSLNIIDEIREYVLSVAPNAGIVLSNLNAIPFAACLTKDKALGVMQGLGVKTYQSDIFNNWVQTEWLTGANGVSTVTAISTASGSFTMDTLNLSQKLYNMLTKVALSGGSYNDWIEAVYDNGGFWTNETPVYVGGLSKEIVFEEVVSTAEAGDKAQGNLAGKGVMSQKKKGGHIKIKCHEPMQIMGIVSITPRLDYSQGNEWHVNLNSMNDLHKPDLDQIGFQDLITDWMNAQDTLVSSTTPYTPTFYSAGKQPAWIHYMTNHNKTYGTLADAHKEMSMTLNRNYDINVLTGRIKDVTTYINPVKFNYPFAYQRLDAQNFWMQIGWGITARRLISAKIIPNL